MWETICDAQAGFWQHSKFWSKFSRKPLSGIEDQKAPPFRKTSDLGWPKFTPEYPPPPFWKTSDLGWPKFTPEYPPISENFRFGMTKVYSRIPPPHFWKLQIWDDQSLLRNTPPILENFRFGMTKVYSGIPPPFRKTSDLGWPKFTPEYLPPKKNDYCPRVSEYRELLHDVETLSNPDNYSLFIVKQKFHMDRFTHLLQEVSSPQKKSNCKL